MFGKKKEGARDTFFYQGNGIRKGRWKYLKAERELPAYARDRERKKVEELYDLDEDIGETTNLAEKYPGKVAELKVLLDKIVTSVEN